eukprot:TRINITY_DN3523_c0_g1_i2.p1 TRINITY_DN3523_c0_g1~~TRINITY_DN3523_c0_g1_i2.p1  ORF type:complete len:242 (-),score=37.62 TRINITY_DN3523_c0_g1_i2:26-751(-)
MERFIQDSTYSTQVFYYTDNTGGGLKDLNITNGGAASSWSTSIASNARFVGTTITPATKIVLGVAHYSAVQGVVDTGAIIVVDNTVPPSMSPSRSPSRSPSLTSSRSQTPSVSPTRSASRTASRTPSVSLTRAASQTPSISRTQTPSRTPSTTRSASPLFSRSGTASNSYSKSPSPSQSSSPSPSASAVAAIVIVIQPGVEVVTNIIPLSTTVLEFPVSSSGQVGTLVFNTSDCLLSLIHI